MKTEKKKLAIKLRQRGLSINEIYPSLSVAKSSVSLWVRNIVLTKHQKQVLSKKGVSKSVIEKRRITRLTKENARRQIIVDKAIKEIGLISKKELFLMGVGLYWAEGAKTKRGVVEFSNSDPRLIKIMMRFFKELCDIPEEKFRGHIHLHPHLDVKKSEWYWHKISQIPLNQFFKTSLQQSRASKMKKDSLPFGTFSIYICSTELFLRIIGWIEGIYRTLIK